MNVFYTVGKSNQILNYHRREVDVNGKQIVFKRDTKDKVIPVQKFFPKSQSANFKFKMMQTQNRTRSLGRSSVVRGGSTMN